MYKNANSITSFEHKMLEPFPMEAINAKTHFTLRVFAGCQEIKPFLQGSQTRGPQMHLCGTQTSQKMTKLKFLIKFSLFRVFFNVNCGPQKHFF